MYERQTMSRVAVVIGIEHYQQFPLLPPAGEGANAVAQRLDRYGEFQVHRLPTQPGQGITLAQLEATLSHLFTPIQGGTPQTALLYFSGYIWSQPGGVAETFLTTSDTRSDGVKGLSLFWLKRLLQQSRIPQWVVILDGWSLDLEVQGNGNGVRTLFGSQSLNFAEGNPGPKPGYDRLYLGACHHPDRATLEGYSLFTQAILEGLDPYRFESGVITSGFLVNWLRMALEDKVLAPHFQDSGRPIILTRSPEEICPYKGLAYFDCNTEDPQHFFGRETLTQDLLHRIQSQTFLPILGASGSGKSSILRAGLLYQLQQGRLLPGSDTWHLRILQPGNHPLLNLAFAFLDMSLPLVDRAKQLAEIETFLAQGAEGMRRLVQVAGGERLVIAVDQFEEVFTLCQDRAERQVFLDCLLGALNQDNVPLQVVITLRSDFVDVCSRPEYGDLGHLIRQYQVVVPAMTPPELRRAITEPAQRSGVALEAELVDQLIADVAGSPGSLPLLEHTLTELWKQRTEVGLKTKQYVRWGGIRGSLQTRANAVFNQFSPEQQLAAKHIFLALTQFGDGITEDSRRRVFRQDLITQEFPEALIHGVLQRLADEKLVVTGQWAPPGTGLGEEIVVDVIHEALIRHWDLLRQWVNENRTNLRQQRSIEDLAQQWFRKGKPVDYLLQGQALQDALTFWEAPRTPSPSSRIAQEFLNTSHREAQRREQEIQAQQQTLQRQSQQVQQTKLRLWMTGLLGGATLVGAFCFIALQLRATESANIRRPLGSPAQDSMTLESRLSGVESADRLNQSLWQRWFPDPNLQNQVLEELQRGRYNVRELNRLMGSGGALVTVDISPDGSRIATGGRDGTVILWDWQGNSLGNLAGHQGIVSRVRFSPDGQVLATVGEDGRIRLWDLNGKERFSLEGRDGRIYALAFSPNGQELATGGEDGQVRRWDLGGNLLGSFQAHRGSIYDVAYNREGTTIATAAGDGLAALWRVNGQRQATLTGHKAIVSAITFSQDGQTLATADNQGQVRLWTPTGQFRQTFVAHRDRILSLAFSPDSQTLATTSTDGTTRLWTTQGNLLGELQGHQDWVYGVAFDSQTPRLVTVGRDGLGRIWSRNQAPAHEMLAHPDRILSVATNPAQGQVATGSTNGTLIIWTQNGQQLNSLTAHRGWLLDLEYNPQGNRLVTAGTDGTLQLWQTNSAQPQRLQVINTGQDWVYEVHFSPNGQQLISRGRDGSLKLWTLEGDLLAQFSGHQGAIYAVQFSPDGERIATRGRDSTVRIWDLQGNPLAGLRDHQGEIYDMDFLPDGQTVVTAGADGSVRLWALNGQPLTVLPSQGAEVYTARVSPDGETIATGSADGSVRLWSSSTGILQQTLKGHQDSVWEVRFSPDSQTIASRSSDGTARLWSLDGTPISTLRTEAGTVYSLDFSRGESNGDPNTLRLVTTSADGVLRFWNRQAQLLNQWKDTHGTLYRVATDPQGSLIATVGADGFGQLWNESGEAIATLEGHQGPIWQVVFSADGKTLATTSADGTVRLWNRQGELQNTFSYDGGEIYSLSFSPKGQELATASSDGVVRRWSLEGTPISTFTAHQGAAFTVAYNPQGDRLASGGADGIAHLWNLEGDRLQQMTGHQDQIYDVSFDSTGTRLASAGADGTARLWNLSGQLIAELRGHEAPIWRVTFSPSDNPDQSEILTSGADGTSRLWTAQGQEIARIPSHPLGTYDSVFNAQGTQIVTGGLDGQLRIWTIAPLKAMVQENCDQLALYLANPQKQLSTQICGSP